MSKTENQKDSLRIEPSLIRRNTAWGGSAASKFPAGTVSAIHHRFFWWWHFDDRRRGQIGSQIKMVQNHGRLSRSFTHTESTWVQSICMWPQEVLYHIICLPPGNDTQNWL